MKYILSRLLCFCTIIILTACDGGINYNGIDPSKHEHCKQFLSREYAKNKRLYGRTFWSPGPLINNKVTCEVGWKQGTVLAKGTQYGEDVHRVYLGATSDKHLVIENVYTKTNKKASSLYFAIAPWGLNSSNFGDTMHFQLENGITLYDPQGKERITTTYMFGEIHGYQTIWYSNGNKKSETFLKGGRVGSFTKWHENGMQAATGAYDLESKDSKPVGVWEYWDEQGNKKSEYDYDYPKKEENN